MPDHVRVSRRKYLPLATDADPIISGVAETVYTFPYYIETAASQLQEKGATVIISSQTPNNPDETGSFVYSPSRFVGYAETSASVSGSVYVDHGQYTANAYEVLSVETVDSYFPNDHTHTSPEGAALVAQAFVRGLVCTDSALKAHVVNATSSIEGSCI